MKKTKNTRGTTPAGIAVFPWLTTPDVKFNADGDYRCKLRIPAEEASKLMADVEAGMELAIAEAKEKNPTKKPKVADKPYAEELDDSGNPTGMLDFNFKRKAKITTKDGKTIDITIPIFDSKNKPLVGVAVWGGSVLKIAYEVAPYVSPLVGAGVSLRITAVQVISLQNGDEKKGDAYGFGEEEGYDAPSATPSTTVTADEADEDDGTGDF